MYYIRPLTTIMISSLPSLVKRESQGSMPWIKGHLIATQWLDGRTDPSLDQDVCVCCKAIYRRYHMYRDTVIWHTAIRNTVVASHWNHVAIWSYPLVSGLFSFESCEAMGLLSYMGTSGLHMRRECRGRLLCHHGLAIATCITARGVCWDR